MLSTKNGNHSNWLIEKCKLLNGLKRLSGTHHTCDIAVSYIREINGRSAVVLNHPIDIFSSNRNRSFRLRCSSAMPIYFAVHNHSWILSFSHPSIQFFSIILIEDFPSIYYQRQLVLFAKKLLNAIRLIIGLIRLAACAVGPHVRRTHWRLDTNECRSQQRRFLRKRIVHYIRMVNEWGQANWDHSVQSVHFHQSIQCHQNRPQK